MGYSRIRIERARSGYEVSVTDPDIVKANEARDKTGNSPCVEWKDPEVEYNFDTSEQVIEFLSSVMDKALPADEYSSAFDKAAKDAMNNG